MKIEGKVFVSITTAFFVLTLLATAALAVPQTINYQGRLAEYSGKPVSGPVYMDFAIYNAPSGGTLLWTETQGGVTVTEGTFSVTLGIYNAMDLPFDEQYYLGVNVNGDGEMYPRAMLVSVPYSMRAKEADTADLLNGQDSTAFAASGHAHSGADITDGTIADVDISPTASIAASKIVQGSGSTLDADKLDGMDSTAFAATAHGHSGADITSGTITGAKLQVPITLSVSSASSTVTSLNSGAGRAGYFEIGNAANSSDALYAATPGSGNAFHGKTTGTGYSGYFEGGAGVYVNGNLNVTGSITGTHSGADITDGTVTGAKLSVPLTLSGANASPIISSTNTGTGKAGYFYITDTANGDSALYGRTNGGGSAVMGYATNSNAWSGYFDGGKGVRVLGDLWVMGVLWKASGSFVQPHPTDPSKELVYAFFEGPEHAVFLRGTARLVDGKAVIDTPEHFRVVAGEEGITVQFTPRTLNTLGLAAVEVTKDKIVVGELMNGTGSFEFDYFITAKRAGFEAHKPIQPNTHFTADMKTADEFEATYAKDDMTITAMRDLLVSNGILTADGKLNMELARELGWVVKDSDVAMKETQ